ncbi:hypothetical protein EDD85DRAFT_943043, partial [Armillaria nabsnona]
SEPRKEEVGPFAAAFVIQVPLTIIILRIFTRDCPRPTCCGPKIGDTISLIRTRRIRSQKPQVHLFDAPIPSSVRVWAVP